MTDPTQASAPEADVDDGPGWMPAIVAAMVLMGIIFFIACPFFTLFLFQHRTDIAIRTLRGSYLQQLEQSLLDPQSKAAVVEEIKLLIADLERGKYENWQAAGIMERLQRLPVLQWGELQAIEAYLRKTADEQQRAEQIKQLDRLRRAIETGSVTSFDVEQVLQPVRDPGSNAAIGSQLVQPLTEAKVAEVIELARQAADRADIPDQDFDAPRIETLVRREIERGASEGNF